MILRLPHRQSRHIGIEADPSVLWVRFFHSLSFRKRCFEVNLQHIIVIGTEQFRDIHPMQDEHVVAFEDDLPIESYCGVGVETVECEDMLHAFF